MLKIKNTIEDLDFIFSLLKFQYENHHSDIYRLLDVFKRDKHIKLIFFCKSYGKIIIVYIIYNTYWLMYLNSDANADKKIYL